MPQLKSISRREALALWPDVQVCDDPANCVKKHPPKPSRGQHERGFVDNWGVIHLTNLDVRVRAQGMYELCVLVALRDPGIKRLPIYHRIWKSHTRANTELRAKFHRMSHIKWTIDERVRAWRLAERAGIFHEDNISFYWWCYQGRRLVMKETPRARSQNRDYISDNLIALWVQERQAGLTFCQIGKKYNYDYRNVWKALVRRGLHQPNVV